jgi:hypothetical protein
MDFGKTGDNRLVENRLGHERFPNLTGTVTLGSPLKSSEFGVILWLISRRFDHERAGRTGGQ